ncbi:MAG TPA: 5-oxoprolinase subunit PxpB [Gemmatimonadaceae bacterium]|nr:5-oxoprolinase subunit PxpB [Gemmatimonadaceae bacterium]
MAEFPIIQQLGDDALLVTFAHTISWDVGVRVRSAARRIRDTQLSSVTDVVPAYTTLAVYFDSRAVSFATVSSEVATLIGDADAASDDSSKLIEIPVRYDGPDLAEVAERTGLTQDELIEKHCSRTYRAYMTGFAPGFTYLGDLDETLVLPRRTSPRVRVPAGSVAIAGAQTAVYPLVTPGGWHLIGTTSMAMFDPARDPPSLVRAGDSVRFVRVDG